ncbi:hypothetical protein L6452_19155 [Arctium lappa]|uniref:Uncharacterized protein n=1 Tax=Arctium lappa TaxID=4217 RepID=A0ACB9B909_ARCLA|nr:hypothetical protein L6452_19155 [Arctium lappa]
MMIEKQSGKDVKYLRTDNGLEFCSEDFNAYCWKEGITRHRTVAHTPQHNGLKPRALKCKFLGYKDGVKGFRLWCPETKMTIISRDVTFDESSMLHDSPSPTSETISKAPKEKPPVELPMAQTSSPHVTNDTNASSSSSSSTIGVQVVGDSPSQPSPQEPEQCIICDRGRRQIVRPAWYTQESNLVEYALNVVEEMECTVEPTSYSEAMKLKYADKRMMATHAVMESLQKNGTWELVPAPKGKKLVRCKWVYKLKEGTTPNEKPRYKTRLVAKGYSQIPGIDYDEIFSPVLKHTSMHALLGMVASNDFKLEQLDVTTAFLNGEPEEEIFMQQPKGFEISVKEGHVCKLMKSLYAKDMGEVQKVKDQLNSEFNMKDLGAANRILGMEIIRDKKVRKLYLSQKGYVQKVLRRLNMSKAKSVNTPFTPHFKLSSSLSPSTQADVAYMARVPYSSAVGSLMYAMICTRPDLAYVVSMVSRYMANSGKEHWRAIQWIFRYLRGTTDLCLQFGKNYSGVIGYVDSDHANDLDNRRSITGYVFTLDGRAKFNLCLDLVGVARRC